MRSLVMHAATVLLPVFLVTAIGSAVYLVFHDDLVAAMMTRQSRLQYAYEEQIATLRAQMEEQATRHQLDQAAVENKVHDLVSREAKLEIRADVVADLASRTGSARDRTAAATPAEALERQSRQGGPAELSPPPFVMPHGVLSFAPAATGPSVVSEVPKPRPEPDDEIGSEPAGDSVPRRAPALDQHAFSLPDRLSIVAASLDLLEQRQVGSLAEIASAARGQAAHLRGILEQAGLEPDRFGGSAPMGGPFVPLAETSGSPFGKAMAEIRDTVASAARLHSIIGSVPLAPPLSGDAEVTSPFGARPDPFLGRPALHTGVDLREDYGAAVQATASGRVLFAGTAGGYGNMVEIDHGNGLRTRYAHMEQILVSEGQAVPRGGVVGRVGATGRATGPHLHYEVRIDGTPVDPIRFISAGKLLASVDLQ